MTAALRVTTSPSMPQTSVTCTVFPPLALDGPYISIRKFARHRIDFSKLIEFGTMTQPVARLLEMASRARLNAIVSAAPVPARPLC